MMGYNQEVARYIIVARISNHNSEKDVIHRELWDELTDKLEAAIDEVMSNPRWKEICANRI